MQLTVPGFALHMGYLLRQRTSFLLFLVALLLGTTRLGALLFVLAFISKELEPAVAFTCCVLLLPIVRTNPRCIFI